MELHRDFLGVNGVREIDDDVKLIPPANHHVRGGVEVVCVTDFLVVDLHHVY